MEAVAAAGAVAAGSSNELGLPSVDQNKTLWVGDVEQWMDEDFLRTVFSQFGEMGAVRVVRDRRVIRGYAFIEFAEHKDAAAAVERGRGEGIELPSGQRLRANWAMYSNAAASTNQSVSDISVWVGNLDQMVQDVDLYQLFRQKYPSVVASRVILDSSGSSRGFGFVRFRDAAEASRALVEMEGCLHAGRPLRVKTAFKPDVMNGSTTSGTGVPAAYSSAISVIGVDPGVSETELARHFALYGPVVGIRLSRELFRATVEFGSPESAESAATHLRGHRVSGARAEVWWQDALRSFAAAGAQPIVTFAVAKSLIVQSEMQQKVQAFQKEFAVQCSGENVDLPALSRPSIPPRWPTLLGDRSEMFFTGDTVGGATSVQHYSKTRRVSSRSSRGWCPFITIGEWV